MFVALHAGGHSETEYKFQPGGRIGISVYTLRKMALCFAHRKNAQKMRRENKRINEERKKLIRIPLIFLFISCGKGSNLKLQIHWLKMLNYKSFSSPFGTNFILNSSFKRRNLREHTTKYGRF